MRDSQLKIDIARLLAQVELARRRFRKDADAAQASDLMPECVAPVPATRRVQLDSEKEPRLVPRGTQFAPTSEPSSTVRWVSRQPVSVAPWDVRSVSITAGSLKDDSLAGVEAASHSVLRLELSAGGSDGGHDVVTLALEGKPAQAFALFQALTRDLVAAYGRSDGGPLVPVECRPLVQDPNNELLPAIDGLPAGSRLLTSLFLNPEGLLALEVSGLSRIAGAGELELVFAMRGPVYDVSARSFRTRCVTALNAFPRAIPLFEIDPTRDEWPLPVPDGEFVHAVRAVDGYEPATGEWRPHEGWRVVYRGSGVRRRTHLAFQDCLFMPQDPPSRFVRIVAECNQGSAALIAPEGEELESCCGATARLLGAGSAAVRPSDARSADWLSSGFAEPLNAASFRRLLHRQALLRGFVADADARRESQRRKRARRWIGGLRLLDVAGDDEPTPQGLTRGRRITLEVRTDDFPGGAYWLAIEALDLFLSLHSEINEFTRLVVVTTPQGEEFELPPRWGRRPIP